LNCSGEPIRLRKVALREADFEYLIGALSEARSRVTEIAVLVSARVGMDHPLAEQGSAAAWKVANVLRAIRSAAADIDAPLPEPMPRPPVTVRPPAAPATPAPATSAAAHPAPTQEVPSPVPAAPSLAGLEGLASEHWLRLFVDDLAAQMRGSGGLTFETAERLLEQRKQAFLSDLETARRMYRTYPALFEETSSGERRVQRHASSGR